MMDLAGRGCCLWCCSCRVGRCEGRAVVAGGSLRRADICGGFLVAFHRPASREPRVEGAARLACAGPPAADSLRPQNTASSAVLCAGQQMGLVLGRALFAARSLWPSIWAASCPPLRCNKEFLADLRAGWAAGRPTRAAVAAAAQAGRS